jgi:hypothetical protein
VAGYVLIALAFVATVPIWEATDEAGHFAYAKYLRDHHALPVQPADAQHLVLSHWFHPPLYYTLAALLTSWIDVSDFPDIAQPNPHFVWVQGDAPGGWNVYIPASLTGAIVRGSPLAVYLLRGFSVLMGAATVVLVYRIVRQLVPAHPPIALGAAGLTAFNPSFVYMTSGVHNDTLVTLLGSALLWWCVRRGNPAHIRWQSDVEGGALLGLALLTKTSALAFAPIVALAIAVPLLKEWKSFLPVRGSIRWSASDRKRVDAITIGSAVSLIRTFGVCAIVAGWWYARNAVIYGDPVAWQRYTVTHAFLVRRTPYDLEAFRAFLSQLARTYWAAFGYMNLVVDERVYLVLWVMCAVSAIGIGRMAVYPAIRRLFAARAGGWIVVIGASVLYFGSLIRYSMTLGGVGHGRLIFPGIAGWSLLLAAGLYFLIPNRLNVVLLTGGVAGLGVLAAVCPFVYIQPAYAIPRPAPGLSIAEANAGLSFGSQLKLVSAIVTPEPVNAGNSVRLRLDWMAMQPRIPDLSVTITLKDREGTILYQKEKRPLAGHLPTDLWKPGDMYEDDYDLWIPANAYTGASPIDLAVRPTAGQYLGATDAGGNSLGKVAQATTVLVVRADGVQTVATGVPTPWEQPIGAKVGSAISLLGFDLPSSSVQPGNNLRLVLYWRASAPVGENYTVFVHVADADGHPVAQRDAEPLNLAYPTSTWAIGQTIRDPYDVLIPSSAHPGVYHLRVGMYLGRTGARLPIVMSGTPSVDNDVDLGPIWIQ